MSAFVNRFSKEIFGQNHRKMIEKHRQGEFFEKKRQKNIF